MESSHFDDFTKALATSNTRRAALRRIGGILGGTALAGFFPGLAFAKPTCKPNGHGCGTNKQCCSGYCDQTTSTCGFAPCSPGTTQLCNGTCVTDCYNTGCSNVCTCTQDAAVGNFYCAQGGATKGCNTDCDCPIGQMCINGGVCVALC